MVQVQRVLGRGGGRVMVSWLRCDRVDKVVLGLVVLVGLGNLAPPKFLPENNVYPQLRLFTLQHSSRTFIMARPKKAEEKPKDSGSLQISVEDFVRTRNSVSFAHSVLLCRDSVRSFRILTASVNNLE